jgi:alpha-tubulin suppressor-like RCC1 family protein
LTFVFDKGQLGVDTVNSEEEALEPVRVPIPIEYKHDRIISVCTKGWHNIVLLENGVVLTCGANKYGQLGRQDLSTTEHGRTLSLVSYQPGDESNSNIEYISTGVHHSVLATRDGKYKSTIEYIELY